MRQKFFIPLLLFCITMVPALISAQETKVEDQDNVQKKSLAFESSFDAGVQNWTFTDAKSWKIKKTDERGGVLSLHKKRGKYQPKVRSPLNIALVKQKKWADFELNVDVLSTHEDYNHRDVCLFFGYQSPTEFYYVHLGKKTDPHANQIFIVNNKARIKISTKTTSGTPWDKKWHKVRIKRDVESGKIEVFFDDMKEPWMTAEDATFAWGQIGLGSFDDTADFDNLKVSGKPGPQK